MFVKILPEVASAKDDEIRLIQESAELKARIDQLEGEINTRKTTIDTLRRTLSEKEEIVSNQRHEIQSLNDVIGERNKEQDGLNGRNRELEEQINTHKTTIGNLHRTLSKKEETISNQLQNINTYSKIRDIAVKAAGNDPEFRNTHY